MDIQICSQCGTKFDLDKNGIANKFWIVCSAKCEKAITKAVVKKAERTE